MRRADVRRIGYAASGESRCAGSGIDPVAPHAVAKAAAEIYLHAYGEMSGLAPICPALANVYGSRQRQRGVGVTGRPMTVYRASAATPDGVSAAGLAEGIQRTARWLRANPALEQSALAGAPDRSQFTA